MDKGQKARQRKGLGGLRGSPLPTSTGCVRPSTDRIAGSGQAGRPSGASVPALAAPLLCLAPAPDAEKKLASRSACRVAEEMTRRSSGRRRCTCGGIWPHE